MKHFFQCLMILSGDVFKLGTPQEAEIVNNVTSNTSQKNIDMVIILHSPAPRHPLGVLLSITREDVEINQISELLQ